MRFRRRSHPVVIPRGRIVFVESVSHFTPRLYVLSYVREDVVRAVYLVVAFRLTANPFPLDIGFRLYAVFDQLSWNDVTNIENTVASLLKTNKRTAFRDVCVCIVDFQVN